MWNFTFSIFAGLQAYSRQLYWQISSFRGIFQQRFKPPPAPPMYWLMPNLPPNNFEEPLMFSTSVGKSEMGKPDLSLLFAKLHFIQTLLKIILALCSFYSRMTPHYSQKLIPAEEIVSEEWHYKGFFQISMA